MKGKIFVGLLFVLALSAFLLVGCGGSQKTVKVDKIAIKEGTQFSVKVGKFDCADYTLVLTKDGVDTYAPLTLDMISATDAMNFYKSGSYTITVTAYGQSCTFGLDVAENEFSGYVFEDVEVEYTGKPVFAEVKGDLPQGTVVFYPDGNSFTEVGTTRVPAILTCNNYKTEEIEDNGQIKNEAPVNQESFRAGLKFDLPKDDAPLDETEKVSAPVSERDRQRDGEKTGPSNDTR